MILNLISFLLMFAAVAQSHHPVKETAHADTRTAASATATCPWLTRGTAAALLGGRVLVFVSLQNDAQGSCIFHERQEPDQLLQIRVGQEPSSLCRYGGAHLKGVANWALECSMRRSHHRRIEFIVGQARSTYFNIKLRFRAGQGWQAREAEFKDIAQQVAGSLY